MDTIEMCANKRIVNCNAFSFIELLVCASTLILFSVILVLQSPVQLLKIRPSSFSGGRIFQWWDFSSLGCTTPRRLLMTVKPTEEIMELAC